MPKGDIIMKKDKFNNPKEETNKGGDIMAVLTKPVNLAFIVKESEAPQFFNHKKGSNDKIKNIIEKARKIEGNIMHKE